MKTVPAIAVALLVAAIVTYFNFRAYGKSPRFLRAEINGAAFTTVQALTDEMAQLVAVPETELPEVALVKDARALTALLPGFQAEIGDAFFVYRQAKIVVLYRPKIKKAIFVGFISTSTQSGRLNQ